MKKLIIKAKNLVPGNVFALMNTEHKNFIALEIEKLKLGPLKAIKIKSKPTVHTNAKQQIHSHSLTAGTHIYLKQTHG